MDVADSGSINPGNGALVPIAPAFCARTPSHEAHRKRQLYVLIPPFISVHKVLQEEGHVTYLQIAAPAQFVGDVCRNVLRPFFGDVEGDDADWVFVLALEQVEDHSFRTGRVDVGFAPGMAVPAEVVDDEVNVPIVVIRHDRGRPIGLTHLTHSTLQIRDSSLCPLESFPANGTGSRLVTLSAVDRGRHEQTPKTIAPTTSPINTRCLS